MISVIFYIYLMPLEFLGIQLNSYSECLKNYTKGSYHQIQLQEDKWHGKSCFWYICLTQGFKLYLEDPKKFMEHGMAPIYAEIHFVVFLERSVSVVVNILVSMTKLCSTFELEFGVTFCNKMHESHSVSQHTCRSSYKYK
jgi:hypothetical protein